MVWLVGAILICESFAGTCDVLPEPQLKKKLKPMSTPRALIARPAGQKFMADSWGNWGEGRARTNQIELYRLDYCAEILKSY